MVVLSPQAQSYTSTKATLEALDIVRARTNALIAPLSDRDLELSHSPLMSPLVWDLGHIAAYEDLWVSHRPGGRRLLRREECEEYVRAVRGRTVDVTEHCGAGDGQLVEMVIQHECQHTETMLQPNQLARLSDLVWAGPNEPPPVAGVHTGPELADVPAGPLRLPSSRAIVATLAGADERNGDQAITRAGQPETKALPRVR